MTSASCHGLSRLLQLWCSTGQSSSTWSGCECDQRGNARGPAERQTGKVPLEIMLVVSPGYSEESIDDNGDKEAK